MKPRRLSNGLSFAFLALIFLFFFVFPVVIFGPMLRSFYLEDSSHFQGGTESVFISPVDIHGRGAFLKVVDGTKLSPVKGEDFLAIAWFNIQDLPESGQRMFLLSRYDNSPRRLGGYAVAITRTLQVLRPEVYWRDAHGQGGWFTFSDVDFLPGYWFMIGLAYYDDSKLGLFVGSFSASGELTIQNAGGYDLKRSVLPEGNFPLKVGSVKTGLFTGRIGPVGMFSRKDLSKDLKRILKDFLKDPVSLPSALGSRAILFWSPDAKTDVGPYNHELKFIEPAKGRLEEDHDL